MKYRFIEKHRSEFGVGKMCRVLDVNRSGYYGWRNREPSQREQYNDMLLKEIRAIHQEYMQLYGSPRITQELHRRGYKCSRSRVARIMRKNGIIAKTKRRFKVTTNSKHTYVVSPNLLDQDFSANTINEVWTSDITYIWTREGWLYLTVILDLFNRQIVGWSMSHRLTAVTTTIPALLHAYRRNKPDPYIILHSDRGVQYACKEFRQEIENFKMRQSMSGKGNCYDNAITESFFHTLKTYENKTRLDSR
jgi:transposase InsO family protein